MKNKTEIAHNYAVSRFRLVDNSKESASTIYFEAYNAAMSLSESELETMYDEGSGVLTIPGSILELIVLLGTHQHSCKSLTSS